MKYIAFLRGINISGKNKIQMDTLKKDFKELGFENVLTILNSGNIIFDSFYTDKLIIQSNIEEMIKARYQFDIPTFVISYDELSELYNNHPNWWNTNNKEIYDNIIFVIYPHTFSEIYNVLGEPKMPLEQIEEYKNNIFWSYVLKDYRKTNWWSKTINTNISHYITIRTANTILKILNTCNR